MTEKGKQPFSSHVYTVNIYFGLFFPLIQSQVWGEVVGANLEHVDRKVAAESGALRRDLKEASQHWDIFELQY